MKVLIIPDSFKGTISSLDAGKTLKQAFASVFPDARIESFPISDGGEGFLEMVEAIKPGLRRLDIEIFHSSLLAKKSSHILLGKDEAYIESALCCGYSEKSDSLNVMNSSSYPLGEAIRIAIENGAKTIHIGIGGTITNDLGLGALCALGAKFYSRDHISFVPTASTLRDIDSFSIPKGLTKGIKFQIYSDVTNPLCGEKGCARVFGPQKGLSENQIEDIDLEAKKIARLLHMALGVDKSGESGAGAGGGIGYMAIQCLGAKVCFGSTLALSNLQEKLDDADLIITGEGKCDYQTRQGKIVGEICQYCRDKNKKLIIVAGLFEDENAFDGVFTIHLSKLFGKEKSMAEPSICMDEAVDSLRLDLAHFALG